jgi:hypothetical protein
MECTLFAESPVIDLGWLRASQKEEGWIVERVAMLTLTGEKIEAGDAAYSVDGRRIDTLNALSASNELDWISFGATYVRLIGNGSSRVVQLRPMDPLLDGLNVRRDVHRYPKNERIAALKLPDENGHMTTFKPGPGSTLIHVWSPT